MKILESARLSLPSWIPSQPQFPWEWRPEAVTRAFTETQALEPPQQAGSAESGLQGGSNGYPARKARVRD